MQRESSSIGNQAELRVFIEECVHSVEQLEILICLVRGDGSRSGYEVGEIVQKLRNHPESCERRLVELVGYGLVEVSGEPPRYRYAPANDARARSVAALDAAFTERRHWVIDAIYNPGISGPQSFAEAFKVRREP